MKKVLVNFVALHGGGTADAMQMVAGLANNGCEVYAIISKNMENFDRWLLIKNLNVIAVNGYTKKINFIQRLLAFHIFDVPKIKKVVKQNKINVMYIPMISYWTYFIWKRFRKLKCVYTMHDVRPHDEKTNSLIWKWSEKMARECDDIIILSNCFKEMIRVNYKKSYEHIHTIPLGNQPYYGEMLPKKKTEYFELLFYGRVDQYKGLDLLSKIYKKLLEKHDNLHLTIASSGNFEQYKSDYDGIASGKITIINRWIRDDEVAGFFAYDKSITLLPYKNATQSGVIPIAMQHKSLVISTNCSGLSEQISDEETGLLVEPNNIDAFVNKVEYAISNWDKMLLIIEKAHTSINELSWDNLAKKMMEDITYDNN